MSIGPLTLTRYPDRESWLEARRFSIGSSDAAALMGESNFASPVSLNYQKRALLSQSAPDPDRERDFDWHRRRESEIADWWWERLQPQAPDLRFKQGRKVFAWDPGEFTVISREIDGVPLSATLDRVLVRESDETLAAAKWGNLPATDAILQANLVAPLELKNAGHWMATHWQEEPPLIYQLQLQHQMLVAGSAYGYLIASIGGQPPVWAEMMRDGEMTGILRSKYVEFWDSVIGNYDVSADYRDATKDAITARHAEANGETIALSREDARWWVTRKDAADSMAAKKKLYEEASNNLKQSLGSASYGVLPDGTILSYLPNKKGLRLLKLKSEDNGATGELS